jgi:hypothetical protein
MAGAKRATVVGRVEGLGSNTHNLLLFTRHCFAAAMNTPENEAIQAAFLYTFCSSFNIYQGGLWC